MSYFKDRLAQNLKYRYAKLFAPIMVGGVSFLVIRHYVVVGSVKETRCKANGQTVIITGPTSGIGAQIALKFVKKGARVILACRDEQRGNEFRKQLIYSSGNKEVSVRHLDLASLSSIRTFAQVIKETEGSVNILVNNAAVMLDTYSKTKELTTDGFETQVGVNFLGHFLLTNLLLETLKSSSEPHIINLTCSAQHKGRLNFDDFNHDTEPYDASKAYRDSKLALWLFTKHLAQQFKGVIRVNCVNPGATLTPLDRNMTYHNSIVSSAFMTPFRKVILKRAQQAAVPVINLALDRAFQDTTGVMMTHHGVKTDLAVLPDEENIHKRLWLLGEKWTRLS